MSAAFGDHVSPGWQAELRLRFNGDTPHFLAKGAAPRRAAARVSSSATTKARSSSSGRSIPKAIPATCISCIRRAASWVATSCASTCRSMPGAHALITTPAATKFYRCDGRVSSQTQELHAAGATLEWLPQENIFYRGADSRTATRVHVDADSRFIGWEINCLGLARSRRALRRRHAAARSGVVEIVARSRTCANQVRPLLPGNGECPHFHRQAAAQGRVGRARRTLGAGGPGSGGHLVSHARDARRRGIASANSSPTRPYAAVSLVDGVLVLRALAPQAEAVRNLFISAWQRLRPRIIGRQAVLPRIWST